MITFTIATSVQFRGAHLIVEKTVMNVTVPKSQDKYMSPPVQITHWWFSYSPLDYWHLKIVKMF